MIHLDVKKVVFFLFFLPLFLHAISERQRVDESNPFLIKFEKKEVLSDSDWVQVQAQLRQIDVNKVLDPIYPLYKKSWFSLFQKSKIKEKADFLARCSCGVRQNLFTSMQSPKKELIPIHGGGDCCIVSFASYNRAYVEAQQQISKHLEEVGFQGYFLQMTGGFPNPTGQEVRYAGVPYCFKIFALLEAEKLGFHKVLWLDAPMIPLRDPKPLFDSIEKTGCLFHFRKNGVQYLLPATRDLLLEETGIDMYVTKSIRAQVVGLDLHAPHVKQFIQEYRHLVELGTPFLSCFPEEHVFGALAAKFHPLFPHHSFPFLVMNEEKLHGKSKQWAQQQGYFFLLKKH